MTRLRPPVRALVVLALTAMAALLYLERTCVSVAEGYIREDLRISKLQMDEAFGAFFIAYALGQVPGGYLAQRYGPRLMLTLSMVGWSVFGIFIALAQDFATLCAARFLLGLSQAAAYPTAALLLSRWVPDRHRGLANGVVTFGGRFGGAAATGLTGVLIIAFVPLSTPATITADDIVSVEEITNDRDGAIHSRDSAVDERNLPFLAIDSHLKNKYPDREEMTDAINAVIRTPGVFDELPAGKPPLTYDGERVRSKPPDDRTPAESERLNRLILEAAIDYPLRGLHRLGWRPTLLSYGLLGVVIGVVIWLVVRDSPRQHPWTTDAERSLITDGIAATPPASTAVPWRALVTSRNQWLYCGMSFGSNYGWVFLITLLPRFLDDRYQVPIDQRGMLTTLPLFLAAFGMIAGGAVTDRLTRRYGRWWGRALPMGGMKLPAAALFVAAAWLPEAWMFIAAMSLAAVCQDFGLPAVWAFAQDTGGRQVGPVLGWGNMWGNFGAGVAPVVMGLIAAHLGWDAALYSGASAFALSGICGLMADAEVRLHDLPADDAD